MSLAKLPAPASSDPLPRARAIIVRRVALGGLVLNLGLVATLLVRPAGAVDVPLYLCNFVVLGIVLVLGRGWAKLAGALVVCLFLVAATWAAWNREGLGSGTLPAAMALPIVVSALLWSPRGAYVTAGVASIAVAIVVWGAPHVVANPLRTWTELTAIFITLAVFTHSALTMVAVHAGAAERSRSRFERLVQWSPHGVVWVDHRGVVQLANPRAELYLGLRDEPLAGRPWHSVDWLDAGSRRKERELFQRLAADASVEVVSREGRHVEIRATALKDDEGQAGRLLTLVDTTERARAERARTELESRLQRSQSLEALGRLAGGVAHDFNNLLTVIVASTEAMRRRSQGDARFEGDIRQVAESAHRAAELTKQLLAFGRKQVLEPRVLCPNTVIEGLGSMLRRLLPASVRIEERLQADLGNARVDAGRLEQVVVNLATNAAEAMPSGGTLTLRTFHAEVTAEEAAAVVEAAVGPHVVVSVEDTGCGMDRDTVRRVFEPFFTTRSAGTGLGLATAHGVVRQSGGHIRVSSTPGKGSCFAVYLPRVHLPCADSTPAGGGAKGSAAAPARLRVLLVEDQREVRDALRDIFAAEGHRVTTSPDGASALRRMMRRGGQGIDLLVTDLVMPNMTGQELARRGRLLRPGLPVLFVSGHSPESDLGSGLGTASAFLSKPISAAQLRAAIHRLFSNAEAEPRLRLEESTPAAG